MKKYIYIGIILLSGAGLLVACGGESVQSSAPITTDDKTNATTKFQKKSVSLPIFSPPDESFPSLVDIYSRSDFVAVSHTTLASSKLLARQSKAQDLVFPITELINTKDLVDKNVRNRMLSKQDKKYPALILFLKKNKDSYSFTYLDTPYIFELNEEGYIQEDGRNVVGLSDGNAVLEPKDCREEKVFNRVTKKYSIDIYCSGGIEDRRFSREIGTRPISLETFLKLLEESKN